LILSPKVNPDDDLCTLDDDEDEGSSSAKLIKSNGSCQQIITLEADEDNKISKVSRKVIKKFLRVF
jgi:hypothetical protein